MPRHITFRTGVAPLYGMRRGRHVPDIVWPCMTRARDKEETEDNSVAVGFSRVESMTSSQSDPTAMTRFFSEVAPAISLKHMV